MRFYAELRSKKELEANLPRLAMALIALAEEVLAEEELKVTKAKAKKSRAKAVKGKSKPLVTDPALPLVSHSKKS